MRIFRKGGNGHGGVRSVVHLAGGLLAGSAAGTRAVPHHMVVAATVPYFRNSCRGSFFLVTGDFVPAGTCAPWTSRHLGAEENAKPITLE